MSELLLDAEGVLIDSSETNNTDVIDVMDGSEVAMRNRELIATKSR